MKNIIKLIRATPLLSSNRIMATIKSECRLYKEDDSKKMWNICRKNLIGVCLLIPWALCTEVAFKNIPSLRKGDKSFYVQGVCSFCKNPFNLYTQWVVAMYYCYDSCLGDVICSLIRQLGILKIYYCFLAESTEIGAVMLQKGPFCV